MPSLGDVYVFCTGSVQPIGSQQQPPPAQPPPPVAVPTQTQFAKTPRINCGLFHGTPLEKGLPLPGSPEFCQVVGQYAEAFKFVAESLMEWIPKLNPLTRLAEFATLPMGSGATSPIYNAIIGVWNTAVHSISNTTTAALESVTSIFGTLLDINQCLYKRYQPTALLGIWLVRTLVNATKKIRGGWDVAVWLTVDLTIDYRSIERVLDMLEEYFAPLEIPDAEEATHAWLLNRITKEQRDCIWQLHGFAPETYEPFALRSREQLEWKEAIQYVRRSRLGEQAENDILRNRGFVTDADRDMAKEMYWELPTIADHLHWTQRNVFNEEYVKDYRLLDGFADKFWPAFGHDLTALGMKEEYAQKHYAAHWIMPSPEQMKEFLYRSEEISELTGKGFSLEDFERILAEQDYNVLARQWFKATAYNVPAISYVKEWFRQDIIGKEELQKYHRWLGFNPQDAENFATVDELQKKRMRASASKGWTTSSAMNAWAIGLIDDQQQLEIYERLGYTGREADEAKAVAKTALERSSAVKARTKALNAAVTSVNQAIDVGILSDEEGRRLLEDAGWPRNMAESFIRLQQATSTTKRVRAVITYIKGRTMDGSLDFATAENELTKLGLSGDSVSEYLSLWRLMITPRRKRRTAQQIVHDVASGHIDKDEAEVRLRNLGYDDADTRLYLADAQEKMLKIETGRKAAEEKSGLQRAKQEERIVVMLNRQLAETVKGMKRNIPLAKLMRWAKLGLIGKQFFYRRMELYGYPEDVIDKYYAEACSGKGAKCETEAEATPPGLLAGEGNGEATA